MPCCFRLRLLVGWAIGLAAAIGLGLPMVTAADPSPSEPNAPSPRSNVAKGRVALLDAAAELTRQAAELASTLSQEQATCAAQREKSKDCEPELLTCLDRLRAVMQEMDELAKQIHQRLAEPAAQPPNDAALEALLRLRIAPAAERLATLAADAKRELQAAKAARHAKNAKLPAPSAKAKPDPRLEAEIRVPADAKVLPPPPPPPQKLLDLCNSGQGKACLDAAGIHEARRELQQAAVLYKLACKHGQKAACAKATPPKTTRPRS